MLNLRCFRTLPLAGMLIAFLASACFAGKTAAIHARVIDSLGQPIGDALVYVESFRGDKGAVDFSWGRSDSAGRVLTLQGRTMALQGPGRCGLAVALIIDGKVVECIFDRQGHYLTNELLVSPRTSPSAWNPRTELLSFPFADNRRLRPKLLLRENRPLVAAFCNVYEPVLRGEVRLSAGYEGKERDMRELKRDLAELNRF